MSLTAIDCQGFAGGFTLGTVKAGFELVGKREHTGGFGVKNCEVNRALLGDNWYSQAGEAYTWHPMSVDLVFGNPPCSGFSVMSNKDFRGMNSKINSCMWDFSGFAARCRPPIAIFESVQAAYKQGRDLMVALRANLEERTGLRYDLYHVLHNATTLGGPAVRRRYFWVVSAIPFGVEYPERRPPILREVIGDLLDTPLTWTSQPYRNPPTWWSERVRTTTGTVDGHTYADVPYVRRALDLLEQLGGWPEGSHIGAEAKRAWERDGKLPPSWDHICAKLVENKFEMGYTTLTRWRWNTPGRVITGGAMQLAMHPLENRTFTHREVARIMGFPDTWRILPLRGTPGLGMTWGKGITVTCGEWIAGLARRALAGRPASYRGKLIGDREYEVDEISARQFARSHVAC